MASPSPYRPPEQSSAGQLFDSLFVVALVAATLLVCLYLTVLSAAPAPAPEPAVQTTAVAEAPAPAADASTKGYTLLNLSATYKAEKGLEFFGSNLN